MPYVKMESLTNTPYESRKNVSGLGTVFTVDIADKNIKDFRIGNKVLFDDTEYQVRGTYRDGDTLQVTVRPWLPEAQ